MSGFNYQYLLIANCEFFYVSQLDSQMFMHVYYGTEWGRPLQLLESQFGPDLTRMQLLNYAIKTCPTLVTILLHVDVHVHVQQYHNYVHLIFYTL